eukprot:scaffold1328_cov375-Pavlova_lutheri.AAC.8
MPWRRDFSDPTRTKETGVEQAAHGGVACVGRISKVGVVRGMCGIPLLLRPFTGHGTVELANFRVPSCPILR